MLDHSFSFHIIDNGLIDPLHVLDARQHAWAIAEHSIDVFEGSSRGLLKVSIRTKSRQGDITYLRIEKIYRFWNAESYTCIHDVISVPDRVDGHGRNHRDSEVPNRF